MFIVFCVSIAEYFGRLFWAFSRRQRNLDQIWCAVALDVVALDAVALEPFALDVFALDAVWLMYGAYSRA